ncbi:multidrug resistance protein MdtO [Paraburkholderia sp. BL23I1N1]|uniref:FUSC family protein n=1 Tax=Paraburkholderia sp. BL23I1N1 TaxID=1938802 RepID=UPI000E7195B9|nr:FUSC family protein [Paraburkholderia sp. BL23I1N1]RKE36444.1 multidrug resistance protein MdtO [Paraburkholderia sp. BL23I1N1]
MRVADYVPDSLLHAGSFLRGQLAAYPGRTNIMLRCVLTSAIVIATSMALEVPELPLSLLVVFYVTQANVVVTRLVGIMFIVGSTLAIGTSILLLKFTFDYPLVRIVVASLLFLGSVYLMRVLKIGVVFFIVAIVIIYVQTFVDRTDQAELLIRAVLWVWVAVNYPIALTLLINSLLLPAEPELQLNEEIHRQLMAVDASLVWVIDGGPQPEPISLLSVQQGALTLQKLLKFAAMRSARVREEQVYRLACIATVSRLYRAASELQAESPRASSSLAFGANVLSEVGANCRALDSMVAAGQPYRLVGAASVGQRDPVAVPATVEEMLRALHALSDAHAHDASAHGAPAEEPMVAPDALSNPAYVRFSLKTLLAVLICYVFYNAADWQGIHTIMLTCVIVALPSLGASTQRAMLRIGGAMAGSALALFMVVFVVPHLDSITGLLLMSLPVFAAGAWVAAGSERIAYAGIQIVFTFSLALLAGFWPTTNLTEIRDRMVGILLGVAVSTAIQMSFWREGEGDVLRRKLAATLRSVSALLAEPVAADAAAGQLPYAQLQLQTWMSLGDCEAMLARVALEPSWQEAPQAQLTVLAQTVLGEAREIMLAGNALHNALVVRDPRVRDAAYDAARAVLLQASADLARYADGLAAQPSAARSPRAAAASEAVRALEQEAALDEPSEAQQGPSPHAWLMACAHNLMREISALPDWHGEARFSPNIRESNERDPA